MKITYNTKANGPNPKNIRTQEWWEEDANEVKNVVNANDSVEVGTAYPIALDRIQGRRYGTWGTPLTGDITVDTTNWQEGACAVVIWEGDTSPNIIGATVQSYSGEITEQSVYSVYMHYLNNRLNVNVFNVAGGDPVPPTVYKAQFNAAQAQNASNLSVPLATSVFKIAITMFNPADNANDIQLLWGSLRFGFTTGDFIYIGTSAGFDKYPGSAISVAGKEMILTYDATTFATSFSIDGATIALDSTAGTKNAITGTGLTIPSRQTTNMSYTDIKLYDDVTLLNSYGFTEGSGLVIGDAVGSMDLAIDVGTGSESTIWVEI